MLSYQQSAQDLAKSIAMTELDDLPGLVDLQEKLTALGEEIAGADLSALESHEQVRGISGVAESASELIERIILRDVESESDTFRLVSDSIEFTQRLIDAAIAGEPTESITPPSFDGSKPVEQEDEIDEELLASWVSGCDAMLGDIESSVLALEGDGDAEESLGEIRRFIHTLKGECGVLSLDIAQKICHEAESLIDRAMGGDGAFPTDEVLALIDWFKTYVVDLQSDPRAVPPRHEALLASITGEEVSAEAADPAPAADAMTGAETAATPASGGADGTLSTDATEVHMEVQPGTEENLNEFVCESREHIASAEEALLELEADYEDIELINSVFRSFHTIKGVAGFMGFGPIVEVAHVCETLLDQARQGDITLNSAYMDLILSSCDVLSTLLESLADGTPATKGQIDTLVARLTKVVEGEDPATYAGSAPEAEPVAAAATGAPTEFPYPPLGEILVKLNIVSSDRVTDALNAQQAKSESLRDLLKEHNLTDIDTVEKELLAGTAIGAMFHEQIIEIGLVNEADFASAIAKAKEGGKRLGEILGLSAKELVPAMREQRAAKAQAAPDEAAAKSPAKKKNSDQTVKVSTNRMDTLVDMVGELVIAHQMVMQDPSVESVGDQKTQRNMSHVVKIIRDLQEVAMSLRMVTLRATFQKMARLVRDVAGKSGKKINFHMEGEDTELDRTVVDEIADPLVHMVRNACDHGIEPVGDRVKAGKPPAGNLTLRAYHSGGSIVIEVQDDGRGLPREKILKKAVERGLIAEGRDPNSLSDHEINQMIFAPGFSTADKVTDISGRGVGMDVVRRNIEALRGKVEILSTPGKGSTFVMMLPLTMAIIDGMIVRVGTQRYVIPTLAIQQSYQPTGDELETIMGQGEMVSVRGSLMPLYRLKNVFNLSEGLDDPAKGLVISIETNDKICALMVDEIIGQQQVVIKSLGEGIGSIKGLSGGAILGDGRVAPIIDVGGLVHAAQNNIVIKAHAPAHAETSKA